MSVKITINGEGLSYEKETDVQKAAQIIGFLNTEMSQTAEYRDHPSIQNGNLLSRATYQSPRQALLNSDAKTNSEKIVVLADFICKRDNLKSFSPKEIQLAFRKAGEPLPKNFTRDFSNTITQGHILETEEKGSYILTDLGLETLESGFSTEKVSSNSTPSGKRRRGNKNKTNVPREEIQKMEIIPDIEGFPGYWKIPTKIMRILWLINYADKKDINGLNSSEVSFLASRLKDQIKVKDFAALTKNSIKKGYLTTSTSDGMTKILKPGVDALTDLEE